MWYTLVVKGNSVNVFESVERYKLQVSNLCMEELCGGQMLLRVQTSDLVTMQEFEVTLNQWFIKDMRKEVYPYGSLLYWSRLPSSAKVEHHFETV